MQASIAGEIRFRLDLYRRCFELCRQGGFSFARLLALPPERLRLSVGDRGARVRIPAQFDPKLAHRLRTLLPTAGRSRVPRAVGDGTLLRRTLRFAQLDADLSPLEVLGWLQNDADDWLMRVSQIVRGALAEVGRGGGGLETAYLVHLLLADELRQLLDADSASDAERTWTAAAVELSLEALVTSTALDTESLPGKLALEMAVTTSSMVLGADPDALAKRTLPSYRTTPSAVRLARRVVLDPIEIIAVERIVDTLARRMCAERRLTQELLRSAFSDMIRDALLLSFCRAYRPDRTELLGPLIEVVSSENALVQTIFNARRRRDFVAWLKTADAEAEKGREAALSLLERVPAVERGVADALGVHGNMMERATLAARGAVVHVLDVLTRDLVKTALTPVDRLSGRDAEAAYRVGTAYRVSDDDAPLFVLRSEDAEAILYINAQEIVERGSTARAVSVQELVHRHFLTPCRAAAGAIGPHAREAREVEVTQDGIAFAGNVVSILDLADRVAGELATEIQRRFGAEAPDVLGGSDRRVRDIEAELERLAARIAHVNSAMRDKEDEPQALNLLADSKAMLEDQRAWLVAALHAARPPLPRLSCAVVFGPSGEALEGRIWCAPELVEAKRLTARSGAVEAVRRRARRAAEGLLPPAFAVSMRRTKSDELQVFNEGVVVSEEALGAYVRAKRGAVVAEEYKLSADRWPTGISRGYWLEHDPERFVVLRGPKRAPVVIFRIAGLHGRKRLFELVTTRSPMFDVLATSFQISDSHESRPWQ